MNDRRVQLTTPTVTGRPQEVWCGECKALTGVRVEVLALFPAGPAPVGTVTFCEVHDDPDDEELRRV